VCDAARSEAARFSALSPDNSVEFGFDFTMFHEQNIQILIRVALISQHFFGAGFVALDWPGPIILGYSVHTNQARPCWTARTEPSLPGDLFRRRLHPASVPRSAANQVRKMLAVEAEMMAVQRVFKLVRASESIASLSSFAGASWVYQAICTSNILFEPEWLDLSDGLMGFY
jgi:hypothetical protein